MVKFVIKLRQAAIKRRLNLVDANKIHVADKLDSINFYKNQDVTKNDYSQMNHDKIHNLIKDSILGIIDYQLNEVGSIKSILEETVPDQVTKFYLANNNLSDEQISDVLEHMISECEPGMRTFAILKNPFG